MNIANNEFPDECPTRCPWKEEPFMQGGVCARCPVFNCKGNDPLIHPADYRSDWAFEYWEFINGKGGIPKLRISREQPHD